MLFETLSASRHPPRNPAVVCVENYVEFLQMHMRDIRRDTDRYREFERTCGVIRGCIQLILEGSAEDAIARETALLNKTSFNKMFPQSAFNRAFRENLRAGIINSIEECSERINTPL